MAFFVGCFGAGGVVDVVADFGVEEEADEPE